MGVKSFVLFGGHDRLTCHKSEVIQSGIDKFNQRMKQHQLRIKRTLANHYINATDES